MGACSAFGCSNRTFSKSRSESTHHKPGLSFHRFPTKPKLKAAWLKALRRAKFVPGPCARVCGEHFTEDSYKYTELGKKLLKPGAIPSIFSGFPAHLQKKTASRKPPKERVFIPPIRQSAITLKKSLAPIDESRFKQDPKNLFVAYRNSVASANSNTFIEKRKFYLPYTVHSTNSCVKPSLKSNQNSKDSPVTEFDPSDYIYPVNMETLASENGAEEEAKSSVILISPLPMENSSETETQSNEDSSPKSSLVKKTDAPDSLGEDMIPPPLIEDSLEFQTPSHKNKSSKSSLIVQNPFRGFVATNVHEIRSEFERPEPCSNCKLYSEANILLGNELEGKEQTICYLQEEIIRLRNELAACRSKTVNVHIIKSAINSTKS